MTRVLKIFWIVLLVIISFLFLYWGKCQLGINLIEGFSWERQLPFLNVFQGKDHFVHPKPGVLLSSSFDEVFPYWPWNKLWAREPGLVEHRLAREGVKGSLCFLVRSSSTMDWAIYHYHVLAVAPGDAFLFEGFVRSSGKAEGKLSVILYDEDEKVLDWGFAAGKVQREAWTRVSERFVVPAGARYLRFQLTGSGAGDVSFDDIRFVKE